MKKTVLYIFIFTSFSFFGQVQYPKKDFRSPVDIPIVLAGTFGELRSNHFHSGIDIKTQRKEGLNIYAAADGYVSRIKVALWGYGKVIYITHPNGYTTVYAHLSKFGKGIERYVKKIQYKKESYETGNIFLKEGEIPVKKGQIIAYSGSTGGFVAPHLHFEIRNTKTEFVINPMLFGFVPKDTISPKIKGLFVYPLSDSSRIGQSTRKRILPLKKQGKNSFTTNRISAYGSIGFGVQAHDQLNNALNKNGLYSLELKVNGHKTYHHNLETFSFAESKYINLLIDYQHKAKYRSSYQRTFKIDGNKLSIYKSLINNGILSVKNGYNYAVKITAKDFVGNKSTINIPVRGVPSNAIFQSKKDTTAYKITKSKFQKFSIDNVNVAFPKNTFYEDLYLDFSLRNGIVTVHKPEVPLNKSYTLTFDVSKYSDIDKKHMYIANVSNKKFPSYVFTRKKKSKFYTSTKALGKFTLLKDNEKPTIKLKYFKSGQWITKHKTLSVRINDTKTGIKSYRATIDGKWILMEYDLKRKTLVYDFSDRKLIGAKHEFKIEVQDNVGNTNMLKATFYKKQ